MPQTLTFTIATVNPVIVSTADFTFFCTSVAAVCIFVPKSTTISNSNVNSPPSEFIFTPFVWLFLPKNSTKAFPEALDAFNTPSISIAAVAAITATTSSAICICPNSSFLSGTTFPLFFIQILYCIGFIIADFSYFASQRCL